jgi:TolA-binding protein
MQYLSEALLAANRTNEPAVAANALMQLGRLQAKQGQSEEARQTLGRRSDELSTLRAERRSPT